MEPYRFIQVIVAAVIGSVILPIMLPSFQGVMNGITCPDKTVSLAASVQCEHTKSTAWTVLALLPIVAVGGVIVVMGYFVHAGPSDRDIARSEPWQAQPQFHEYPNIPDIRAVYRKEYHNSLIDKAISQVHNLPDKIREELQSG